MKTINKIKATLVVILISIFLISCHLGVSLGLWVDKKDTTQQNTVVKSRVADKDSTNKVSDSNLSK